MKKGLIGAITLVICVVIGIILLIMCTVKVPAGYVAVQYNINGGIKQEVLSQGWHIVAPTTKTTLYTVGIEQSYLTAGKQGDSPDDESFTASSSEGKAIGIDLTFTYQYDANRVHNVFTQFKGQSGKAVRDSFIKPNIVSWSKEVIARYKVADILGTERANVNIALTEYLAKKFDVYGIVISNVSLIDIRVDDETANAISNKINALQNQEEQAIRNKTNVDKAQAEADARIVEAEARKSIAEIEAQAALIEAEATAAANKMIAESLTDEVLKKIYYETWNGVLPDVVGGNSMINIPAFD